MASIIDYFNANHLKYSASSLSCIKSGLEAERAFAKSGKPFNSQSSSSGQWWQVSFSIPVVISSYIITYESGYFCSAKSWDVSISNDNKTFVKIKTQTTDTIAGNTQPFALDSPASCKHFRLTLKSSSCPLPNQFFFYGFDCFGVLGKIDSKKARKRIKCKLTIYILFMIQ